MSGNRKDVWWSCNGADWHEVTNTPWLPRHASSVFVFDEGLWMVAGNSMTSDAWKLCDSSETVSRSPTESESTPAGGAQAQAPHNPKPVKTATATATATFAANCFWGTEAIFGRTIGVITTAAGFSNGLAGSVSPSYEEVSTGDTHHAEVVRLTYNPGKNTRDLSITGMYIPEWMNEIIDI